MANKDMDEFLEPEPGQEAEAPAAEPVAEAPATPEAVVTPEPEAKAPEPAPKPEEDAAAAEPEDVAGLRKALLAERGKRNDYKGERDRLAGEMAALKAQMEDLSKRQVAPPAPQPPQPQERVPFRAAPNPVEDPQGYAAWFEEKQANDRANVSEIVLRNEVGDDAEINGKIALFQQAAAANPRLLMALRVHPDPYRWAYEQGKQIEAKRAEEARNATVLTELGGDPQAWVAKERERIIAEERAKLEAEYANRPMNSAPVQLPQSLGTARSAAPRQSAAVAEEIPFDGVFGQRKRRQA